MNYSKLVTIVGVSGLFEMIGNKGDGVLLKSLEDLSVKFISSRKGGFTQLETIEIFTTRDNVNLSDIFIAMRNSAEELPSEKDAKSIKAYFEKVYPDMDFDRVYGSDMKKMVKWFTILQKNGIALKERSEDSETDEVVEEVAK